LTADEGGRLTLVNQGSEPELNAPIDAEIAPRDGGSYFYALSTGHTLPDDDPAKGQPVVYVYKVDDECGLKEIQTISDDLPNESSTVFGVAGVALC